MNHRENEKKEKKEIWSATPKPAREVSTTKLNEEEEFCASLNSGVCGSPGLEW